MDLEIGFELLSEHTDLEVLGDKAYISAAKAAELWEQNRIVLRTIPRSNQKQQVSAAYQHLHNVIRQVTGQFRSLKWASCSLAWKALY